MQKSWKKVLCSRQIQEKSEKIRGKVRFIVHVKVYNKNPKLLLTIDNRYNTIVTDANNCSVIEKEN